MAYEELFLDLLRAEREEDVTDALTVFGLEKFSDSNWLPYGGIENNFGIIGTQRSRAVRDLGISSSITSTVCWSSFRAYAYQEAVVTQVSNTARPGPTRRGSNEWVSVSGVPRVTLFGTSHHRRE